jgi:membrane protease YdiL (CAAX protease family)
MARILVVGHNLKPSNIDLLLTVAMIVVSYPLLASAYLFARGISRSYGDIGIATGLSVINFAALVGGSALEQKYFGSLGLRWNWVGKLLTIGCTTLMVVLLPHFDRRRAGITVRQRPGTFWPTLAVVMIVSILMVSIHVIGLLPEDQGKDVRLETWLFQLTMPSVDEELFFRGVLLFYTARAFGDQLEKRRWNVDPSIWIITVSFALAHCIGFHDLRLQFNAPIFLEVMVEGYLIGWARQQTGSVVLPMIAHTLANTLFRLTWVL